ncbi:OmpA family protein [Nannocystis sp. ILAH1]|uniref:OmpA family protein n=1 Tax=unclassified Nannocystis TaxID=2627009 RepID=UPI00226E3F42|nr:MULTISPECIES: OmpA family protein [unclassified Nannocystis]MCY0991466.1 OmpA family protein [Nannocystis sp. ILAH1]MCY1066515.1 OmpA family protein [Nannocystis sp. RBIL2]
MTLNSKPRTAALIPAGVLLFAAAASPEAFAAAQDPAAPKTEAAPATEAAPSAEASAPPAEASAPPAETTPAAPASAGAQASAGAGKAEVKADASVPKARKSGRREAPDGVILDEKTGKVKDTRKWIHRYSPERHLFELGIFGGLNLPPDDHDLYKPVPGRPDEHKALWRLGPAVGARIGYFPLRIFGIEAEFSATPTFVRNVHNSPAFVYGLRGSAVLQLPYRVTPFLLGGYGMLGISSPGNGLGSDVDPAGHWGGGLKIFISRMAAFRVDARHIISAKAAKPMPAFTSHAQVTVGFSLVLGRVRPQPAAKDLDWDKDGVQNDVDKCPKLAGDPPDGCPSIDSDNDTFLDKVDKCPFEAGVAPDGCPPPDTDKDGIIDADDQCPTEPWPEAPGCPPPPDADGDKIVDKDDKCPMHPESYNGFEDSDGCPDKLPEKAKEWDKRPLEGINFETRSDKIKKGSEKTLDVAVGVLKEFPSLKIEIQGHTDDVGGRDFNLELSQRRADSVKRYLVEHGIEESRVKTTGFGPDKPIDPAKTSKARAKNRRIEFKVLIDRPEGASSSDDGDAPTAAPTTGGGK